MSKEKTRTCFWKLVSLILRKYLVLLIVVFLLGFALKLVPLGILHVCLAAVGITGVVAVLVVLAEYKFGKISGGKEIELYPDFYYLGPLPAFRHHPDVDDKTKLYLEGICNSFQTTGVEHHVVMAGMLLGADIGQGFFDYLQWNYAMTGRRVLILDIVDAKDVADDQPLKETSIVICAHEGRGVLPLENYMTISDAELLLLKSDLELLRKEYDLIIFRQEHSLSSSLFMVKINSVCDGMLIGVGAKCTPRKSLRALATVAQRTNSQIMTILSYAQGTNSQIVTILS